MATGHHHFTLVDRPTHPAPPAPGTTAVATPRLLLGVARWRLHGAALPGGPRLGRGAAGATPGAIGTRRGGGGP